jgi:membrane protein implicated in regulation of membrane protease activity
MFAGDDCLAMALLLQPALLPFTAALGLLLLVAALQLIGLDGDAPGGGDDGLGAALDWLNVGRLPLLILFILLLAFFAMAGFAIQFAAASAIGLLPWPLAAAVAAGAAIPATRFLSRPFARILPMDETTAVAIDSLVGRRARIVLGTARAGSAARAQVADVHGQTHFVMVEPAGDAVLTGDDLLLLVGRDGAQFQAIAIPEDIFSEMKV